MFSTQGQKENHQGKKTKQYFDIYIYTYFDRPYFCVFVGVFFLVFVFFLFCSCFCIFLFWFVCFVGSGCFVSEKQTIRKDKQKSLCQPWLIYGGSRGPPVDIIPCAVGRRVRAEQAPQELATAMEVRMAWGVRVRWT